MNTLAPKGCISGSYEVHCGDPACSNFLKQGAHSLLAKEEIDRIWLGSAYTYEGVRVDPQDRLYLFVDRLIERICDVES
jgi:hypothetical protein